RGERRIHCARGGLPRHAASAVRSPWSAADFRRSDDGVPRRGRRGTGAAAGAGRSHHTRQDHRRRDAGGSVRGARGPDAARRARGPVYQAGTLAGNPVAMAAGLATVRETERPGFYEALERRTARLVAGIGDAARRHGVTVTT